MSDGLSTGGLTSGATRPEREPARNLHHLIERSAQSDPQAPALSYKQDTVSYLELWDQVRRAGEGLREIGVTRAERVAVFLDKRIETVVAMYGTSVAGATVVPLNPLLRAPQVGHILRDCGVSVLITTPDRYALLREQLASCPQLTDIVLVGAGAPPAGPPAHHRTHDWAQLLEPGCAAEFPEIPASDAAVIIYTSGSTGKPKGVVLSHANALATSMQPYLGNTSRDVILVALPLSFDAGFCQLTLTFSVGAHAVLMNYLLPGDVPRLCRKHGVTGITCVAPLWIQIAEQKWSPEATARLRYFGTTGGRMPKTVLEKLREVLPTSTPFLMYGMTEAFRSTYLDPAEVDRRPESIGKSCPTAEILIVRPDGSRCEPGEEGELVHCGGPHIAQGYWNDAARSAEKFRPVPGPAGVPVPAVWSGDRAVADDDGFIYFIGRRDEMIKTSGYRISPTEVEEIAYGTGLVRDAVAVGVSDESIGQHVRLIVSPAAGGSDAPAAGGSDAPAAGGSNGPAAGGLDPAELLAAMKTAAPQYMVPRSVVVLDTLPRSPNGKFDRARLREEYGT